MLPIVKKEASMTYKRLGSIAVLFILLTFPASASMVSFLLVETGINEDVPNRPYSSIWEGGLMAAFFDAGFIVTNSPIARMERRPEKDFSGPLEEDFREAVEGGAEYFILGFLDFQAQDGRIVPVEITIKVYDSASIKLICEQGFPVGKGRNLDDEYKLAQSAGWILISHLSE